MAELRRLSVGIHADPPKQLFEGNPTLKHFSLWHPTATFTDPITMATGYAKYTAQWYGLPAVFKPIQLQHHRVTNEGNPIEFEMTNKYVVKGIKKEQVMNSVVAVHIAADGKIDRVEDRWNGKLPEGAVSDVSDSSSPGESGGGGAWRIPSLFALVRWAVRTGGDVAWWTFCTVSWWSPFLVGDCLVVGASSHVVNRFAGFPEAQRCDGSGVCQGPQDGGGGYEDEGGTGEGLRTRV